MSRTPSKILNAIELNVAKLENKAKLVEAKADKFNQVATAQILKAGHRSFPAFANGILYARDGSGMVAVSLKGE